MSETLQSQTLIEYQVIPLPFIEPDLKHRPAELKQRLQILAEGVDNRPFELRGSAPLFFILPLFWKIRSIATEVVYRRNETSKGYVIFTVLDPDEDLIRPVSVSDELLSLNGSSFEGPLSSSGASSGETGQIDLARLWDGLADTKGKRRMEAFLSQIEAVAEGHSAVQLRGDIPAVPALACINRLVELRKEIAFEHISFQRL